MGKPLKAATIVWALLLGGFVVFLAGSAMLPSTKRARIAPEDLERMENAVTGDVVPQTPTGPVMRSTKSEVLFDQFPLLSPSSNPSTQP